MGTGHSALQGIAIRAVAALAVAGDEFHRALLHIDHADAVALRVGQVDIAVGADTEALGTAKRGRPGRAAMTAETLLPCAGDVMNPAGLEIEFIDRVTLAQGQPEVAVPIKIKRPRAVQRRAFDIGPVRCCGLAARAGESGDDAGLHVHFTDALIANVTDEQVAAGVELDAMRLAQGGLRGRAAVAGEARLAGAGHGRDDLRLCVHPADEMIFHFDEEQVAVLVEADFIRLIQGGLERRASVAGIAGVAGAGDGRNRSGAGHPADDVVAHVATVERAVATAREAVGVVELSVGGGPAITGEAGLAGACEGEDLRPGLRAVHKSGRESYGAGTEHEDSFHGVRNALRSGSTRRGGCGTSRTPRMYASAQSAAAISPPRRP